MANFLIVTLIFCNFFLSCIASAKDLGSYGQTFPIMEKSLLQYLKERLQSLSENDLINMQKYIQKQYVQKITHPIPVKLSEAKIYRQFHYDPTICSFNEIKNRKGEVIVPIGKCYNPLENVTLSEELLFFDGTNPKHMNWAKQNQGKWILTKGAPIEIENSEKKAVYFDQMGKITSQFGIKCIPAKVSQDGLRLKIEEIPCQE